MKTEYEVKVLDINIDEIKNKLDLLWAKYLWEDIQKRYVYDTIPYKEWKWVRLRQKWTKATLTVKEILDDTITWTKEVETLVWDFDDTNKILEELWYKAKAYQENKRISYKLDWVEIELDFWPKIPAYMEIEWQSEQEVEKMVNKLWFKMEDTTSINTTKVYKYYWIDLDSIKDLRF